MDLPGTTQRSLVPYEDEHKQEPAESEHLIIDNTELTDDSVLRVIGSVARKDSNLAIEVFERTMQIYSAVGGMQESLVHPSPPIPVDWDNMLIIEDE